jgi:Lrp/AsnC family transcriptional regulator, leucine-responsive regulatory protein
VTAISRAGHPPASTLDRTDWAILGELQADGRVSYSELGRRVGLTPPAVAERIRRLRRDGVVVGVRAVVDLSRLGLPVEAVVLLHATDHQLALRFERELGSLDGVLRCDRVTGEESYLLRVATPSVPDLEDLVHEFGPYGRASTWVILGTPVHGGTVVNNDRGGAARILPKTA